LVSAPAPPAFGQQYPAIRHFERNTLPRCDLSRTEQADSTVTYVAR
jgi:hypothetical protein